MTGWDDPNSSPIGDIRRMVERWASEEARGYAAEIDRLLAEALWLTPGVKGIMRLFVVEQDGCAGPAVACYL